MLPALLAVLLAAQEQDTRALEERMGELVNVEREARRIAPLRLSAELSSVARAYSFEMAGAGRVHHELDRPVEERIREVFPDTCLFGENVSKHSSIDYSIGDLLLSEGHRANLLNPDFTEIGIGIVRGSDGFLYITQDFRKACDPPPKRR